VASDAEPADADVTVPVTWNEVGLGYVVRALLGAQPMPERGLLTADLAGLTIVVEGSSRAAFHWSWRDIRDLRIKEGVASYLVVDSHIRPRRKQFALLGEDHAMLPWVAVALLEQLKQLGRRSGWNASSDASPLVLSDRSQRFEARTAQFVREHPDAYVIRTVTAQSGMAQAAMTFGLAFATATRYGHLVADATGLHMYQGPNDLEWEKPWREITELGVSDDGRALKLDAVGWHAAKFYAPCEPNGDVLLPFAMKGVLAELRSRRP
jgi:hypothetical protein